MDAIVDNWLLESTSDLLSWEEAAPGDRTDPNWDAAAAYAWTSRLETRFQSLLDFLEVFVLHDKIYFEVEQAHSWARYAQIQEVADVLAPVSFKDHPMISPIVASLPDNTTTSGPSGVVEIGAKNYLALSRVLGLAYWPVLDRRRYLESNIFTPLSDSFLCVIRGQVDRFFEESVAQLKELLPDYGGIVFPNFGSVVLANCESRSDILSVAKELRSSRETVEFRGWLANVEGALARNDVFTVRQSLAVARDAVDSVRVGLEGETNSKGIKFNLGLSPSISFEIPHFWSGPSKTERIASTYLRGHLETCLRDIDVGRHIRRLFPEISKYVYR